MNDFNYNNVAYKQILPERQNKYIFSFLQFLQRRNSFFAEY